MQIFKYETHTHTSQVSKCSRITAKELVRYYKSNGYSGICITDHFLNGNTTVPKDKPWRERIDMFCVGYDKAYAEGSSIGLNIFFGWEYSYNGTDFLTYGLDKKWLINHPFLLDLNLNDYCDLVRASGGFIVHAHPFREDDYIPMIRLLPRKVDAVEVINSGRLDFENKCADEYSNTYNLLKIAGSDTHSKQLKKLSGIQLKKQLMSVYEMIEAIKNKETSIFEIPV